MAGRRAGQDKGQARGAVGKSYFGYQWPRRAQRTPEKDETFLNQLRRGTSVTGAAIAAGYSRRSVYEYKEADPEFAKAWDDAWEAGGDVYEDEAHRRGVEGVDEPVFYQGVECGVVRKYSDTLLTLKLKGRRPQVYRENVNMALSGQVQVQVIDYGAQAKPVVQIEGKAEDVEDAD